MYALQRYGTERSVGLRKAQHDISRGASVDQPPDSWQSTLT